MKILWILSMLLMPLSPPQFQQNRRTGLLVYGSELPMVFFIQIQSDHHVAIYTLPMQLLLPATCANHYPTAIAHLTNSDCLIDTLETYFPFTISDTLFLYNEQIEQDIKTPYQANEIHDFSDMQDYFHALAQNIDIQMLWHMHDYISTQLSLSQIWRYYHLYAANDLTIDYYFLHVFAIDATHMVALDTTFYQNP